MTDIRLAAPLGATILALVSTPASAHHLGPGSFGAGGGSAIFAPETLDEGHWAAGLRLVYTRPEQRSDEVLEDLAGRHVHAHNTDYDMSASLGLAYGITHRLTVSAELPYVRHDGLREGHHEHGGEGAVNGVDALGDVAGIGDLNLLATYRLTAGDGPQFALIGGLKLPIGSTHKRSIEGERLETEHQPGTGSWGPIFGASGSIPLGSMHLTASALYQLSTGGAQHTRLGDRMQGGVALSHRFGEAPDEHAHSHNHHHGDELDEHQAGQRHSSWEAFVEATAEWEGRQRIAGEIERDSGGKSVWLTPGARFNSASGLSFSAAVGVPLWQDIRASHPDNAYRVTLSLGRAF